MDDLQELEKLFGKLLQAFPEERRRLVEQSGEKLHQQVLRNIDRDLKQGTGRLRAACEKQIGSGGGYAAIRNNYQKAPHAHLVENGHRLMKGAKKKKDKNGNDINIKGSGQEIGWVQGRFMYHNAANALADELERDAERLLERTLEEAGFL